MARLGTDLLIRTALAAAVMASFSLPARAGSSDMKALLAGIDRAREAVRTHSALEWIRFGNPPRGSVWIMAFSGDRIYAAQYPGVQPVEGREMSIAVSDGRYMVWMERLGVGMPFGTRYSAVGSSDGVPITTLLAPSYRIHSLLFASSPEQWVADVIRRGRFSMAAPRTDGQVEIVEGDQDASHRIVIDPKRGYIVTEDTEERVVGTTRVTGVTKVLRTMLVNGIYLPIDRTTTVIVRRPGKPPTTKRAEWRTTNLTPKVPEGQFKVFPDGVTVGLGGDHYITRDGKLEKVAANLPPGEGGNGLAKLGIAILAAFALGAIYIVLMRRNRDS